MNGAEYKVAASDWRAHAKCATVPLKKDDADENDTGLNFFTTDTAQRYQCRALCFACPVRWECLRDALARPELVGIWGGVDEYEIRRALSVDAHGDPCVRARKVRCPYCKSHELKFASRTRAGQPVRCEDCDLDWVQPGGKRSRKLAAVEVIVVSVDAASVVNDDHIPLAM